MHISVTFLLITLFWKKFFNGFEISVKFRVFNKLAEGGGAPELLSLSLPLQLVLRYLVPLSSYHFYSYALPDPPPPPPNTPHFGIFPISFKFSAPFALNTRFPLYRTSGK